ncbi:sensor histidine kinase [Anaeromicropila populeti]|uniref:histidine kinase n=1 Tax=Anaeromicropila populeti TaxID=37658 RepID=A0A1I6JRP0_9FIRM|nr:HAMP domain-containing sensor histidine kinase [Anaeromicropila populeti]SFR81646.1 Signal transduction histidine kinase [Anaeromicropila populeti]
MSYIIGILSTIIVILVVYINVLKLQIRRISFQLEKRLREQTRQPVSLELIHSELNQLVVNMNKCLEAEEVFRLRGIREEKQFKELIANISHDLRTPLTAIKGYQQLLEQESLSEGQQRKLKIARKHTEELGQLIEHFFEYSYLINAEPDIHLEKINLTKLVTECLLAVVNTLEERQLSLSFNDSKQVFVTGDKEMVLRIVQNLIRNAMQHSDGQIEISIMADRDVTLSFRNPVRQSVSIDVTRIFDRFYTGDKSRSGSTGLGLSIVRHLAEQLGGSVQAGMSNEVLEIQVIFKKDE